MNIITALNQLPLPISASACALGMFDGLHVAHQLVCEQALRQARQQSMASVVFSFSNHPQSVLAQTPTQLLSSLDERLAKFEALGFDVAVVIPFNTDFQNRTAGAFVQEILVDGLRAKYVSVGYDYRFGKDRQGDSDYLTWASNHYGFGLDILPPVKVAEQIVSSTLIRKLVSSGQVEAVLPILGHGYTLTGTVETGLRRGHQLGFPTANLEINPVRLIPGAGTYSGLAELNGITYKAVCNIGHSPTFEPTQDKRIEIHLLGYTGPDFYNTNLAFTFHSKLRDEQRFPTVDALIAQIQRDCQTAAEALIL